MPGNYSQFKSYITGDNLTASDLNQTDLQHITFQTPPGYDDYSTDLAESRLQTSPATLAISLAGELERLRYTISKLAGKAFWDEITTGFSPLEDFRGLHLRTHPDSDVAVSKVALLHADEIIMNDGSRYATWDNFVVDISVAGAGGLDTGSEAASTWYEVHAIAKSTDGTRNLLLHKAKFYSAVDQSNGGSSTQALRDSSATQKLAQGFKPSVSLKFFAVDLSLIKNFSPSGNMWVTIETDSAGNPSGTVLATSELLSVDKLGADTQEIRFIFRDPPTLTAATQYHIVFNADYPISATAFMKWFGSTTNTYADGEAKKFDGSSWSVVSPIVDFDFGIYPIRADDAVTMPAGYDQRCLIGHVFNGGTSDFEAFVQKDRIVFPLAIRSVASAADVALVVVRTGLSPVMQRMGVQARIAGVSGDTFDIGPVGDAYDVRVVGNVRTSGRTRHLFVNNTGTAIAPLGMQFQSFYAAYVFAGSATAWITDGEW